MQTEPFVVAVMLVNGREAMARRAILAFNAQTYKNSALLIWDTGEPRAPYKGDHSTAESADSRQRIFHCFPPNTGATIGALRNSVNSAALDLHAEVIVHWDSDDWSHPNRIAEQVALLVDSGKECVGYNEVLFWREIGFTAESTRADIAKGDGEAWLYRNVRHDYAIGASLCYWADVWQRRPFPDLPKKKGGTGEDTEFVRAVRCAGVPALGGEAVASGSWKEAEAGAIAYAPRLICAIHGGNSMDYSDATLGATPSWQRVPAWDEHARGIMAL